LHLGLDAAVATMSVGRANGQDAGSVSLDPRAPVDCRATHRASRKLSVFSPVEYRVGTDYGGVGLV